MSVHLCTMKVALGALLQFQAAKDAGGGILHDYLSRRLGAANELEGYAGSGVADLHARGIGDGECHIAGLSGYHDADFVAGALDMAQGGAGAVKAVAGFDEWVARRLAVGNANHLEIRAAVGAGGQLNGKIRIGLVEQLIDKADTDLSVQLTSGPDGSANFQMIRVPHGQPPRNPFIEPGDGIQRAGATLRHIECAGNEISVVVSGQSGDVTLSVPDPSRVQIRNTTPGVSFEFICGPQSPRKVIVEYTAARILRGLELQ